MCCVSVVQENWPLELVPKIGVGIMGMHVNKTSPMYHTGKNGVKAGETLARIIHECRREFDSNPGEGEDIPSGHPLASSPVPLA